MNGESVRVAIIQIDPVAQLCCLGKGRVQTDENKRVRPKRNQVFLRRKICGSGRFYLGFSGFLLRFLAWSFEGFRQAEKAVIGMVPGDARERIV